MLTIERNAKDQLLEDGWKQGPPPQLGADHLLADIDAYSEMECPTCGHRHQQVLAFHRGGEYCLLCRCRACAELLEP